jgi:hypothetical protein
MSQEDVDEQNARKEVHGSVTAADLAGLYDDRGPFDAAANAPALPSAGGSGDAGAILKGDVWTVSVAGTVIDAGGNEVTVNVGDTLRASADEPANYADWVIDSNAAGSRFVNGPTSTITQADNGKVIGITHTAAHACSVNGYFPPGFNCLIVQEAAAGQIEFTGTGGAVVHNRQSHTKTQGGRYSVVSLCCTGGEVVLAGDTGT